MIYTQWRGLMQVFDPSVLDYRTAALVGGSGYLRLHVPFKQVGDVGDIPE